MSTKGTWTRSEDLATETRFAAWIRLENEAMQDCRDVADALEHVVWRLRQEEYDGTIRDRNGNSVGAWDIEAFQR